MALRKLLLILLIYSTAHGQSPMYKLVAKKAAAGGGCINPLLDDYGSASAAYSLRKLDADYSGSAIRVRRSSDNTEQDIGFTGSCNELDEAALIAFVGSGGSDDGFVVTWYDQSGNGRDATQATAGNQPKIVDNGVVLTLDGQPAVYFDRSNNNILKASFSGVALTAHSVFAVFSVSACDSYGRLLSMRASGGNDYDHYAPLLSNAGTCTTYGAYAGGFVAGRTVSGSAQNLYSANHTGSTIQNSVNDGSNATQSHTLSTTIIRYNIGGSALNGDSDSDGNITGYVSEVVCYPSDQSGNKAGILSNINSYYTIY